MVDIVDRETRSTMMSNIGGSNTKPELIVRSMLHRMGLRFRVQKRMHGCKPDITLAKHRTVVLVHGCFWHRHSDCKYAYTPKSRTDFWSKKFKQNIARDKKNERELKKAGWRVVVVWECETRNINKLKTRLKRLFSEHVRKIPGSKP